MLFPVAEVERTYFDDFLAFPPEYVALLGLGILFIILFIIVVIIICVTSRVSCLFAQQPIMRVRFIKSDFGPIGSNSTWLDSTRLDTFDVSSPCILAVSS